MLNVSMQKPSDWAGLGSRRLLATPTKAHLQSIRDGSNRPFFFVLITSKQSGLKIDMTDMILCLRYASNDETPRHRIVSAKALVGTSPIFSFRFVLNRACTCRAPVYTSPCLVISHSVFVLLSSVINSPFVGLLIYIFTYLHSLLVGACLSPSVSGGAASGRTSGYVVFRSSSPPPEVCACLISTQTLTSRPSLSPQSGWTHSKERGEENETRPLRVHGKKKKTALRAGAAAGSLPSPVTSRKVAAISITPAPHLTGRVMERRTR